MPLVIAAHASMESCIASSPRASRSRGHIDRPSRLETRVHNREGMVSQRREPKARCPANRSRLFASPRLKLAGQCTHWIEVSRHRNRNKSNFHSCSDLRRRSCGWAGCTVKCRQRCPNSVQDRSRCRIRQLLLCDNRPQRRYNCPSGHPVVGIEADQLSDYYSC